MTAATAAFASVALLAPLIALCWLTRESQKALVAALEACHEDRESLTRALVTAQNPEAGSALALSETVRDRSENQDQTQRGAFVGG